MLNSVKKQKLDTSNFLELFPDNSTSSNQSVVRLDQKPETMDLTSEENNFYTKDKDGNISLNQVSPELKFKMEQLIELSAKAGINITIKQQQRSIEEQNKLYQLGRDKDGKIQNQKDVVTMAKGNDYASNHQWGTAFDICINEKGQEYNEEKLKKVGEIGKSIGLEWGGDWKSFSDSPHFELKNADEIRNKYNNPGEYADGWYDLKK